jgi:import inner membrane translocase subunit TIM23
VGCVGTPWAPNHFAKATNYSVSGVGAILGPTVGTALWRFTHRRSVHLIDSKDHQFFQRIAKNRVDASLQSPTAPVPDYYGQTPCSFSEYFH